MSNKFRNHRSRLHLLPAGVALALLATACASIGRPEGGPRDENPPRFLSAEPAPGTLNHEGTRITLRFDENVQLDNPVEKVVISPPQIQQPTVSANGRHVTVNLRDTMLPNTTYTIDFTDAIKDLNEGNVLEGLAVDFSTGGTLDTLRISGMVLEARTLEPAQGMLVGVYSTPADSAITTLRLERIAKTNDLGQFTVRNLKPGSYQVFALTDMNRDYHWDRTEDVAFFDSLVSPSTAPIEVADTFVGIDDTDSIVTHAAVRFLPDDVLLTWFNEDYHSQYLKEYKRNDRRIIYLEMAAHADSLPRLTVIASGSDTMRVPMEEISVLERSATNDTLKYWLTDTAFLRSDSLLIETTYRRVDTLNNLVWATDTLKFFNRKARGKKALEEAAKLRVRTLQDKIDSVLAKSDTIAIDTFALSQPDSWLTVKVSTGGTQELHKPLFLEFDQPLAKADTAAIKLEYMPDSTWIPVPGFVPSLTPADSVALRNFRIDNKWLPGMKYRLSVDSMAIYGIYPVYNKPIVQEFTAKKLDDYSTVIFHITGLDSRPAVVELLNGSDKPMASAPVSEGGECRLEYIAPGTYYARLYIDADNSGTYTNGNLLERRQPEETYYFSKKLNLKKNWDLEQTWDIYELPLDMQKPGEIKKNKPKENPADRFKKEKNKNGNRVDDEDDDEEYNEFGSPFSDTGFGSNSRFRTNNRR